MGASITEKMYSAEIHRQSIMREAMMITEEEIP